MISIYRVIPHLQALLGFVEFSLSNSFQRRLIFSQQVLTSELRKIYLLFWKKLGAKVSLNLGNDIPIVKILITRSLNSNPCPEFPRSIQSLSKIGYNKMIFSLGSNRETCQRLEISTERFQRLFEKYNRGRERMSRVKEGKRARKARRMREECVSPRNNANRVA